MQDVSFSLTRATSAFWLGVTVLMAAPAAHGAPLSAASDPCALGADVAPLAPSSDVDLTPRIGAPSQVVLEREVAVNDDILGYVPFIYDVENDLLTYEGGAISTKPQDACASLPD